MTAAVLALLLAGSPAAAAGPKIVARLSMPELPTAPASVEAAAIRAESAADPGIGLGQPSLEAGPPPVTLTGAVWRTPQELEYGDREQVVATIRFDGEWPSKTASFLGEIEHPARPAAEALPVTGRHPLRSLAQLAAVWASTDPEAQRLLAERRWNLSRPSPNDAALARSIASLYLAKHEPGAPAETAERVAEIWTDEGPGALLREQWSSTVVEHLARRAVAASTGESLSAAARLAGWGMRQYMPALFRPIDARLSFVLDAAGGFHRRSPLESPEHELAITGARPPGTGAEGAATVYDFGTMIDERLAHALILVHELAHAAFAEISPAVVDGHTVGNALNEGAAVMAELIVTKGLLRDAAKLGLTEEDQRSLKKRLTYRLRMMRKHRDHYSIGTLKFARHLLRRSDGAALTEFLSRVPAERQKLRLNSDVVELAAGRPELFVPLLTSGRPLAEEPLSLAVEHVRSATPLDLRRRAEAASALESSPGLPRFARSVWFAADPTNRTPDRPGYEAALRLASLGPRSRAEVFEAALRWLLRYDIGWLRAFGDREGIKTYVDAVESLDLTQAERARWLSTLAESAAKAAARVDPKEEAAQSYVKRYLSGRD